MYKSQPIALAALFFCSNPIEQSVAQTEQTQSEKRHLEGIVLRITQGDVYKLPPGVDFIHFEELTMEVNSAIEVPYGSEEVQIISDKTTLYPYSAIYTSQAISTDVEVVKSALGDALEPELYEVRRLRTPADVAKGYFEGHGLDAPDFQIDLNDTTFIGTYEQMFPSFWLLVISEGGYGAPGAVGEPGTDGIGPRCRYFGGNTRRPSDGKPGGAGSPGGDGGDVVLNMGLANGQTEIGSGWVLLRSYGGLGGQGGAGGRGGRGAPGVDCPLGYSHGGFTNAVDGPPGPAGKNGAKGTVNFSLKP